MIRLQNVSKTFYGRSMEIPAVKKVSLDIEDKEIFGIIGFSGAGKSTLVRCINLLERPTTGNVIVGNQDLTTLDAKALREVRKKIGMIFQHFNLMRSRTVYQNVAFPLKHSKLSKKEMDQKILSLLELVDLKEKKDAYPSQLSGGQKQRVAIARALANDPDVLLCDEATSALDPQTTQSILKLLKRVNEELGITIVLITHEMHVVKEICDRVAVMEDGEIKELGTILEIFAHPKAEITKNFIETADNIHQIYDLIKADSELTHLCPGEQMWMLKYADVHTKEAMISGISRKFQVDADIIFGSVEILKGIPFGRLVVIVKGERDAIEKAQEDMVSCGIDVEVMKRC